MRDRCIASYTATQGWVRYPPNLGYVSPKCILMYSDVFLCIRSETCIVVGAKRPSKYIQKKTDTYKKNSSIGHVSGPAIHG